MPLKPKSLLLIFYLALLLPLTILGLSSWFRYSTFGFDFEEPKGEDIEVTYYRLRWDDGSTWIGWAVQPVPNPDRPLDWFDPGGVLLDEPTLPRRKTWLNQLGFWWIDHPKNDPFLFDRYGGATATFWLGAPSWLVLLGLWAPIFWVFRPRKPQSASGGSATATTPG